VIVVDSCGWLEYFKDGPLADAYENYIHSPDLIVPTVVLYEVYKVVCRELGERQALHAVSMLKCYQVVPLDARLALEAADISLRCDLPMADAIVYATAQALGALLVSSDEHFEDLPDVQYLARK